MLSGICASTGLSCSVHVRARGATLAAALLGLRLVASSSLAASVEGSSARPGV